MPRPFGFVATLGVIALAGMIIRNSVIPVDQIEADIAAGLAPWDAVIEATVRRLRPILLTAAAASQGTEAYCREGEADLRAVLDARRTWRDVEERKVQSSARWAIGHVALIKALGGGWRGRIQPWN